MERISNTLKQVKSSNCGDCELCTHIVDNRRIRLETLEVQAIENIIDSHNRVEKNQVVFQAGATFKNLYTVHSGMFKAVHINPTGKERIIDLFIPGQVMGLDGIHQGRYQTTVIALSSASYCEIPFNPLQQLAIKHQNINRRLMKMLSEKIFQIELIDNEQQAKQRLLRFVKKVSDLYYSRGYSASRFPFQVSQRDLANYLGLAEETLSRTFTKLKKAGIMNLKEHQIDILDMTQFDAEMADA